MTVSETNSEKMEQSVPLKLEDPVLIEKTSVVTE